MEKLPMCRICLAENVRVYIVTNRNLHELYEKLTDVPFVTEDSRPILACFICCSKLKQCYRLHRQCQEAEELFGQMINEDYKLNPLINQDHFKFYSGFIKSPTENISIDDVVQTESIAIKEELPAVCEVLDIIEPKEEHQSDGATVTKKPKLDTRRIKEKDAIKAEQMGKDKSDSNVIWTTQKRTSKPCKGALTKHMRIHTGVKPFKCDICQRSYSAKSTLIRHIRIHTGEKPYKCDICHLSFSEKRALKNHIYIHTGEKPYKCDICQRSFSELRALKNHIYIHTGEKPYKCDICQLSFSVKGNLTKHIYIHTGEKPYKCDICQSSFRYKGTLKRHIIRIHAVENPYKCDICQRSFRFKGTLKNHVRIHTYKCDICGHGS